jgi:hypothetical protein
LSKSFATRRRVDSSIGKWWYGFHKVPVGTRMCDSEWRFILDYQCPSFRCAIGHTKNEWPSQPKLWKVLQSYSQTQLSYPLLYQTTIRLSHITLSSMHNDSTSGLACLIPPDIYFRSRFRTLFTVFTSRVTYTPEDSLARTLPNICTFEFQGVTVYGSTDAILGSHHTCSF